MVEEADGEVREEGAERRQMMAALVATTRPQRLHAAAQRTTATVSESPARDAVAPPLFSRC